MRDLAEKAAPTHLSAAMDRITGACPISGLVERPCRSRPMDAAVRAAKAWLTDAAPADAPPGAGRRASATRVTRRAGGAEYGTYDLYVPPNLDDRIET